MFASDFCRNRHIRFLQRCRLLLVVLPLTIAFSALEVETFAEETKPKSASAAIQTEAKNVKPVKTAENAEAQGGESPKTNKSNEAKSSQPKAAPADNGGEEDNAPNFAEILKHLRNSYAKKHGIDLLKNDLILSQSSGYIFLSRKRVRDVSDNILDHWYLSSFEDEFNLTLIEFESISVSPLSIDLNPDVNLRISLNKSNSSMLDNSEMARTLNPYINFPIPESVMVYIKENSEEVVSANESSFLPDMSTSNYFVLFLAFFGFAILIYIIYRIIVWAFMLDQNPENDLQKGRNEEVVTPIDMNAYSAYFYQITPEDKH